MKRLTIFLILFMALGGIMYAQTGLEGFNYQTIVRDNAGIPIVNKAINFRFSILDGGVNGPPQYVETQLITTNASGLANHIVGKGTPASGTFNAIPFQNANQFLKVEADVNGGVNFQTIGAIQLVSVPYAQYAGKTIGMSVVKLLSVNNSASVILTNNTLYPSQFYTQEYTAGAGEIAVIQFATSFEAVNQHSVVINMNVGVSENNGFFSVNSVAQDIRLAITSGYGGVMNTNAILPLTAGKTYKFSPAFFIGSGSIGYFLKVNGTVMILKQ